MYCVKQFEKLFETEYNGVLDTKTGESEYGAFYVESIQGTGGYVIPPKEYFPMLKEILDRHKILLVDDEKDFRDLASDWLTRKGFDIKTAVDGNDAMEKTKSLKPDLILMDIKMPNKDGIAAALELKASSDTKDIPIVFLTSLGDASPLVQEVNRKFSKEIGAIDYIKKGADLDVIAQKIKEILK